MKQIQPRIEILEEKKLVGMHLTMSLVTNRTGELWSKFMPKRKEIANKASSALISMQVYGKSYYNNFHPANAFEKWAAAEVTDVHAVPAEMESFLLVGGQYAVFDYKGSSNDNSIFQYIFETWLPGSAYAIDDRPHFEVLGEKYKNNDPDSEEEIWIPIRMK